MTSALGARGGSRRWTRIREHFLDSGVPYVCVKCGTSLQRHEIDVGHVIARRLGGTDDLLQVECKPCNRGDGARLTNALRAEKAKPNPIVRARRPDDLFGSTP